MENGRWKMVKLSMEHRIGSREKESGENMILDFRFTILDLGFIKLNS
jgi:hypothetical protein